VRKTEEQLLNDNGGDYPAALREACICYNWAMDQISGGYVRANTSHLRWTPKPLPDTSSTGDDWLKTGVEHEST